MMLEFVVKKHYGRMDLYPSNEAARVVLRLKQCHVFGEKKKLVKCIGVPELEFLKLLGHEVRIVQEHNLESLTQKIGE